jgi:predicted TIM-barrel fold metal-dependent hydrolase
VKQWVFLIAVLISASVSGQTTATTQPASEPQAGIAVYVGDELLKGYSPKPALVTPVHLVPLPRFPAIDIHCHWGVKVEPQFLLQSMDELGLKAAVNLSGGYGAALDEMLRRYHDAAPDRLFILANLDFDRIDDPQFGQDMAQFLTDARAKGVSGLKIFKDLGLTVKDKTGKVVPVDDPRLDPVWARCGELGMPVLIHSGDPIAFFQPIDEHNERWMQLKRHPDWSFHGDEFPDYADVMAQHIRMIKQHPKTVFISAHLANSGEDLKQLDGWLKECPNMYVDLSGRVAEIGRQPYAARRFLTEHQDRVLFGTDRYPGRPDQPRYTIYYRFLETQDEYFNYYDHDFPPEGEWKIYGVGLPDEVLVKIYHQNAERALAGQMPVK